MLLENYYESYDENLRLFKDKVHNIEFITTVKYLKKFVNKETLILDVGCGTGAYSMFFSKLVKRINAVDIVSKHIEQLKIKISDNYITNIIPEVMDAQDLSTFTDNSFDIVLCLGPIYHLESEYIKERCISEAIRVLKNDGILVIAYINQVSTFVSELMKDRVLMPTKELMNNIFKKRNIPPFTLTNPKEIENLMDKHNIIKLYNIGTDGISNILKDTINSFSDKQYKTWLEFHLNSCEDQSILGYSSHGLYIGKVTK